MKTYNRTEAAEVLGVSSEFLRLLEKDGRGPRFSRLGPKLVRYTEEGLRAWLDANAVDPHADTEAQDASPDQPATD